MSNILRKNPYADLEKISIALPVLATFMESSDSDVLADCLGALSFMENGICLAFSPFLSEIRWLSKRHWCSSWINQYSSSGCFAQKRHSIRSLGYCAVLLFPCFYVLTHSIHRTIGNICRGKDHGVSVLLNDGILPPLANLLNNSNSGIQNEVCWVLSNILAGPQQHIQEVLDLGLMQPLIQLSQADDYKTRKEALWAVANSLSAATPDQALSFITVTHTRTHTHPFLFSIHIPPSLVTFLNYLLNVTGWILCDFCGKSWISQ